MITYCNKNFIITLNAHFIVFFTDYDLYNFHQEYDKTSISNNYILFNVKLLSYLHYSRKTCLTSLTTFSIAENKFQINKQINIPIILFAFYVLRCMDKTTSFEYLKSKAALRQSPDSLLRLSLKPSTCSTI